MEVLFRQSCIRENRKESATNFEVCGSLWESLGASEVFKKTEMQNSQRTVRASSSRNSFSQLTCMHRQSLQPAKTSSPPRSRGGRSRKQLQRSRRTEGNNLVKYSCALLDEWFEVNKLQIFVWLSNGEYQTAPLLNDSKRLVIGCWCFDNKHPMSASATPA